MKQKTTDQVAAHELQLACRRLDTAFRQGSEHRKEAARGEVMVKIVALLQEFGCCDAACAVEKRLPDFDGRCIEKVS